MFRMRVLSTIVLCGLLSLNSCDQPKGEAVVDTWKPAPPPRRAEAPPETSLTPTRDPQAETTVQIVDRTHTLAGVNLRLADLISVAYRTPESPKSVMPLLSAVRVISPTPLAEQHYDVRIYLPRASAEQLRAELRRLLQERFGLTAHREPREADVLVLQLLYDQLRPNPNAELEGTAANRITVSGTDLSLLAEQLEERLDQPVVNETNVKAPYQLSIALPVKNGKVQPLDLVAVRKALQQQLGLDLTPGRRVTEFLIVEQARPAGQRPG